MEPRTRSTRGSSLFDGVLMVGGVADRGSVVAFGVLHFIAGLIWFLVKVVLVVALVAVVVRLVVRRH